MNEIIELSFAGSPVPRLTGFRPALTPSTTTGALACASRTTKRETV